MGKSVAQQSKVHSDDTNKDGDGNHHVSSASQQWRNMRSLTKLLLFMRNNVRSSVRGHFIAACNCRVATETAPAGTRKGLCQSPAHPTAVRSQSLQAVLRPPGQNGTALRPTTAPVQETRRAVAVRQFLPTDQPDSPGSVRCLISCSSPWAPPTSSQSNRPITSSER